MAYPETLPCPHCSTAVPLTVDQTIRDDTTGGGRYYLEMCPQCNAILKRPADLEVDHWITLVEPTENLADCIGDVDRRLQQARRLADEGDENASGEDVESIGDEISQLEQALLMLQARARQSAP